MDTDDLKECRQAHHRCGGRKGRGPSSAWMHDPKTVLGHLPLKTGDTFVDLGCGAGDYAFEAVARVGAGGKVLALDKGQYLIDSLQESAESRGLSNIAAFSVDITAPPLPIQNSSVDVAFIATVLHIFT